MPAASPDCDPPAPVEKRTAAGQLGPCEDVERMAESEAPLRQKLQPMRHNGSEPELLTEAAYVRLLARLESMPVIEQAKGILMAQSRCTPDEAFAMLRAASQRSNVRVKDLAEEIVGRVSNAEQKHPTRQSLAGDASSPG
jgi:ANTAR domain